MSSDPIRTHFVVLCNSLDVGKILPYLRAERMVTPEEYETLSNTTTGYNPSIKQRRERLLLMMPKKGSDYFKNFGNCLVWSGQRDLAKHIGVDVGAVPRCPHQESLPGSVTPQDPFQAITNLMTPGGSLPPGMSSSSHSTRSDDIQPEYFATQSFAAEWTPSPLLPSRQRPLAPGTHLPYPTSATNPSSAPLQYPTPTANLYQPNRSGQPQPSTSSDPPKVFILYHKDEELQLDDLFAKITDIASILNSVGGFKLSFDYFHQEDEGNWGAWTEERIMESQYVVMLCSPQLARGLRNPSGKYAEMKIEKGLFFTSPVINLINSEPHKFVPIFLSNCVNPEWIPTALKTAARYTLDVDNFITHLRSEINTANYYREVADTLQMEEFGDWARLVRHLQRAGHEVPPSPPVYPIRPTVSHQAQPPPRGFSRFTQSELVRVASTVSSNWTSLGIRLGVSATEIDSLEHRYSDSTAAAMAMFGAWMRLRGHHATRGALKGALHGLGFGAIAETLFEHD